MKILYYTWNENSCNDMVEALIKAGCEVTLFSCPFQDYFYDRGLEEKANRFLNSKKYDMIFSFNYFPFLSNIAMKYSMPYLSWVYDCPHLTLYSTTISNGCNYIFLFDRNMLQEVKNLGGRHVYHMPLGVNTERLNHQLELSDRMTAEEFMPERYRNEISFVGSLYENNFYDQIEYLPEYLHGYLHGLMDAQKQLWGVDLVHPMLNPSLVQQLSKYIKTERSEHCVYDNEIIFCYILHKKITSEERISALNLLADHFPVSLYSASGRDLCIKADYKGIVSYVNEMPDVFRYSKINLNITLRSITSGIPLRAMDILACGGFLLTNYQPELCEFLEPDRDFVYFTDFEDMCQKADYYLKHDQERNEIAFSGWKKVQELFSYRVQTGKMLEIVNRLKER